MELVYLWVEDYKNIHKQGFNFSPRFSCEYDDVEKELTIKENDDYIENFFGENINVTAIVGKNGSGKSSVLEILFLENKQRTHINTIIIYYNETTQTFYYFSKTNILNKSLYNLEKKQLKADYFTYINISHFINDIFEGEFFHTLNDCTFDESMVTFRSTVFSDQTNLIQAHRCFRAYQAIRQLYMMSDSWYINLIRDEFNLSEAYYFGITILVDERWSNEIKNLKSTQKILSFSDVIMFESKIFIPLKYQKDIKVFLDSYELDNNDFYYSFYDENKNELILSSGEQVMIYYLSLFNLYKIENNMNYNYLIIDEIELYLHSFWQQKFFKIMIRKLQEDFKSKSFQNNLNIVLSTHSPFILSDIPKQNIIFLDKDEKGNCKVVDGLKEKKQTFGANIHTLLSDSFFMEDGLMGEFAKGKIDEVIELLNKEKLDEKELKYCEQIISIIGEPIVKNQLQRMLDSKRLKKVDEIDAIKRSMKAMQKRLDELEK